MQLIRIGEQMKRINLAICVITYKREKGLARLLISIAELIIPDILKEIALFVIDNDARESARESVAEFRQNFPIDIIYGNESRGVFPLRAIMLCAWQKNMILSLLLTMMRLFQKIGFWNLFRLCCKENLI